jgi:hypothetical protein
MVRSSRGSTEYKAVAPISAYNGGFASDFVVAWLLKLSQLALLDRGCGWLPRRQRPNLLHRGGRSLLSVVEPDLRGWAEISGKKRSVWQT